jgi:hypothetical protein
VLQWPAMRRALGRLGINPRQYAVLLDLFGSLSERFEILGSMNTVGLWVLAGLSALFSILLSLFALAHPPVRSYVLMPLGFTMYQLFIIIAGDAANSLLNPQEASVLAHQPIGGLTYAAAKASHLALLVVLQVVSLNALPAMAGLLLPDTRWFFPLTHLLAALLAGFFVAFLVCATYGWFYRFVAPERLKAVALGMQAFLFAIIPAVGGALGSVYSELKKVRLEPAHWAWFPPNWFISTALLGHSRLGYSVWQAAGTVAATSLFIFLGMRCFAYDYLARATMLVQGRSFSAGRPSRQGWLAQLVRRVSGSPAGTGAYAFTGAMIRRDWNLRRQALPMVASISYFLIILSFSQIRISPFAPGKFAPAHVFPHVLALMLLLPVVLLSQCDQPQGAWMFLTLPFRNPRAFARGVYLAVWLPGVGLPHLLLLLPAIWFWGWTEASLFVAFSAALASLYLSAELFLLEGLPFANPIRLSAQAILMPVMLLGGMCAAVLGFFQWLLFRRHGTAAVASAAVVLVAFGVTRLSLGHLVSELRTNLLTLAQAPSRLFKSIEPN